MTIIRNKNSIIYDSNISLKAKGLYFFLNMFNSKTTLEEIKSYSTDGITSIRKAIQELIDNEYLQRTAVRKVLENNRNVLSHYEYNILK